MRLFYAMIFATFFITVRWLDMTARHIRHAAATLPLLRYAFTPHFQSCATLPACRHGAMPRCQRQMFSPICFERVRRAPMPPCRDAAAMIRHTLRRYRLLLRAYAAIAGATPCYGA